MMFVTYGRPTSQAGALSHNPIHGALKTLTFELSRPLERSFINLSDPNISHVILSQTLSNVLQRGSIIFNHIKVSVKRVQPHKLQQMESLEYAIEHLNISFLFVYVYLG